MKKSSTINEVIKIINNKCQDYLRLAIKQQTSLVF